MAQPTSFTPANRLEELLVAAADGGEAQRRAFEQALLSDTLYAATPKALGVGEYKIEPGQNLDLNNARLPDGRIGVALFTSPERVNQFYGRVDYFSANGRQLLNLVRSGIAILNPGQIYWVYWEPRHIEALLAPPRDPSRVLLTSPAKPPKALIERLHSAFDARPEVRGAWLSLAQWPDRQGQSWFLDVRVDGDHEALAGVLDQALNGFDLKGRQVDMSIHQIGGKDGMGLTVVAAR